MDEPKKLQPGRTLRDVVKSRSADLLDRYTRKEAGEELTSYVSSGLPTLDQSGFGERGTLAVLVGHSGEGKSTLILQVMEACAKQGKKTLGFLMEDPMEMVADRVIAKAHGIDNSTLRRLESIRAPGVLSHIATEGTPEWMDRVMLWDYRMDSNNLVDTVRKYCEKHRDIGLVVVDYMQIFGAEGGDTVERVINKVTIELNEIAKQFQIFVLVTSQIQTAVIKRGQQGVRDWQFRHKTKDLEPEAVDGYRPVVGDFAWGSQVLTQKARAIWVIFRPAVWLARHGSVVADDVLEITNEKSNYSAGLGGGTKLRLHWNGAHSTISEYTTTTVVGAL